MDSVSSLVPLYSAVYGPLYFSSLMSTGLYGVTCMQTFFYYVHYPKDPLRMKNFVAVLWALDTIHEGLTVAGVYKYIFAGLVDPLAILDANPELAVSFTLTAFFVHRIYNVSGKNIVVPLLWMLIITSLVYVARAFYMVDGKLNVVGALVLDDRFFSTIVTSCLSLSAAVDVLIAIAMTYLLLRMRNATGFANTAHILQRLIVFAVNTGTWTALFAVLSVVLVLQ
ncbi:hypothetical protein EV363DRAFT_1165129 [Boletus edulis]|nr:hypothetical protein EV363DRAFT_1165129 [Boletus edulis]